MSIQQFSVLSTFADSGMSLRDGHGGPTNDTARNGPPEYPFEGIPIPEVPEITPHFLQTGLFKDFAKKTPEQQKKIHGKVFAEQEAMKSKEGNSKAFYDLIDK